jgi:glycosyltransferase involved in cell wall biosynthesis
MKCRILYVIGQLRSGGSERQLVYRLRAMDRARYCPAVAVWSFSEADAYVSQIRALGVEVIPIERGAGPMHRLRALRRIVGELRPEVVQSFSFYTNFAVYWACLGRSIVAVGSLRASLEHAQLEAGPILGRLSARWPRHQSWNSEAAVEESRCGSRFWSPAHIFVVRNGLDLDRFRNVPLPSGPPRRIVGVGSLFENKRWDRLLHAAAALRRKGLEFQVQIVGGGPLRPRLEELASELGVQDIVEWTGSVKAVEECLAQADLLVHVADHEGCPNSVMEAMACGRAVIATEAGDVSRLVEDERTGFVVARGDDAALRNRIERCLTQPELCRRLGEAGGQKARQEFGLDRMVADMFACFRAAGWQQR